MSQTYRWLWCALMLALPVTTAFSAATKTLPGHVPAAVVHASALGRLPATNRLNLALGVPLRDPAGLNRFLRELYDPASTNFHRYLLPAQFTERFGPAESNYQGVIQFARSNGLAVRQTHVNRLLLDVTGSVGDIEKAFHVTLRTYRHPTEARNFFAPDAEPSVASSVPVLDVSGLSDFGKPRPLLRPVPAVAGAKPAAGSGPGGGYIGADFRNAYAPGAQLDGSGQMVGLLQFTGYDPGDIFAYEARAGLPNVPLQNVLVDGFGGEPGQGEEEVCLDIEMAIAMAPNLSAVVVFEAPDNPAYWNDILNAMAASNQIKQFSSSWGFSGNPSLTTDQILQQMAAQGQSFFQASGDGDAWTNPIWQPAESPYLTVVGGTTLSTSGPGNNYLAEHVWNWGNIGTAWNPNGNGFWGSGGGVSANYAIPDWQTNVDMTTNLGSTTMRNIPDVALAADNVYVAYGSGLGGNFGGTSCAAPLWAGFMALANQQAAANGNSPAGFINPAIYALGASTNYTNCFNDIVTGSNTWSGSPNLYYAVPGYDLCTGWGTPAGTNFINALAGGPDPLLVTPAAGFAASGQTGGPFRDADQNFTLNNIGANSINWSLINTSAWLIVSADGGTLAAGAQTNLSVSLAAIADSLPAGNYTAAIIFSNETTGTAQPRQFTFAPGQSVVRDGGFESGTFYRWSLAGNSVSSGYIFNFVESPNDNFDVAHSGNFGAFLGDTSPAAITQTLPTLPGQGYWLSFWLNNPSSGAGQHFAVNWNTGGVTNAILSLTNPPVITWSNFNFLLTAAGSNTVLQFQAANPPNYFGLDDVSVIPVTASFQTVRSVAGDFQLTLGVTAGWTYQVQYKTDLLDAAWFDLGSPVVAVTNTLVIVDTNALRNSPQHFYRLSVSP